MRALASISLLALLPLFAGLYTHQSKENIGTFTGAIIGGAAGAALTGSYPGVVGGSLAGAYVGNRIGKHLDPPETIATRQ